MKEHSKRYKYNKVWRLEHPEKIKLYNGKSKPRKREWYLENKERILNERRNNPKLREKILVNHRLWRDNNRDKWHKYCRKYRDKLTLKVLTHYGGKCYCCGETNILFLTIDHINNNGAKERRSISGINVGTNNLSVYRLIVKNNYPDTYRVACYNCNCGRERNNGVCPHKS